MEDRRRLAFCVADGVGGGNGGAAASRIVCAELLSAVVRSVHFNERVRACKEAIRKANARILRYAERAGFRCMATTFAFLALDPDDTRRGIVGHAGDSRVYRFRDGEMSALTDDHTMAEELGKRAERGGFTGGNPACRHPLAHMLTRAVGSERDVCPEWREIDVRPGDAFLVCSDGVHGMISAERLRAAFLEGGAARKIASRIARDVGAAGAQDNYSLIVIKTRGSGNE